MKAQAPKPSKGGGRERLAFLEESRRRTLERLERLVSLGVPEGARPLGTVFQVLAEAAQRLRWLMPFKAMAFFLMREPGGDFYLARAFPPSRAAALEREMALLVESGSAAWALQRRRPVFTASELSGGQALLHSMATASRIRGLFLGIPSLEPRHIEDDSLSLLSLVLRGTASLLEGIELYALLRQANAGLKAQVGALERTQRILRREVLRRRKAEAQLIRQALYDPLTGLANRTLMLERIQQAMRRAQRRDACHALAFLDLDRFKLVNDILGHAAGDELLVQAGRRMTAVIRQADTLARFGGDEFVIFLEEIENPAEAMQAMKRVLAALGEPFEIDGHAARVTASIGLVAGSLRHQTPQTLLKNANTALHTAKEAGRNRIKLFTARMGGRAQERSTLLCSLRRAVDARRVGVSFLPVRAFPGGAFGGFLAVPAWRHRTAGRFAGHELVELARREAVAWDLWLATLDGALAHLAAWRRAAPRLEALGVCVGLDKAQQPPQGFAQVVLEALERAGAAGDRLRLLTPVELLVQGGEAFAQELARLRQAGVGVYASEVGERFFRYRQEHPGLIAGMSMPSPQAAGHTPDGMSAVLSMAVSLGLTVLSAGSPTGPEKDAPQLFTARQALAWARKAEAGCGA